MPADEGPHPPRGFGAQSVPGGQGGRLLARAVSSQARWLRVAGRLAEILRIRGGPGTGGAGQPGHLLFMKSSGCLRLMRIEMRRLSPSLTSTLRFATLARLSGDTGTVSGNCTALRTGVTLIGNTFKSLKPRLDSTEESLIFAFLIQIQLQSDHMKIIPFCGYRYNPSKITIT